MPGIRVVVCVLAHFHSSECPVATELKLESGGHVLPIPDQLTLPMPPGRSSDPQALGGQRPAEAAASGSASLASGHVAASAATEQLTPEHWMREMAGERSPGEQSHPDHKAEFSELHREEITAALTEPFQQALRQAAHSHRPTLPATVPLVGSHDGEWPWVPSCHMQPEPKGRHWPELLRRARAGQAAPTKWPVALPAMSQTNIADLIDIAARRHLSPDYLRILKKNDLLDIIRGNEKVEWTVGEHDPVAHTHSVLVRSSSSTAKTSSTSSVSGTGAPALTQTIVIENFTIVHGTNKDK